MRVWVGRWAGTALVRTNASAKPSWLRLFVCAGSFKVARASALLIAHARRPGGGQLSKHPRLHSPLLREVVP